MARIFADYAHNVLTLHDAAGLANALHGCSDFHVVG
jgi:hypothetical protein